MSSIFKRPLSLRTILSQIIALPILVSCGSSNENQTGVAIETTTIEATLPQWEISSPNAMQVILLDSAGFAIDSTQSDSDRHFAFELAKDVRFSLLVKINEWGLHLSKIEDLKSDLTPGPLLELRLAATDSIKDLKSVSLVGVTQNPYIIERNQSYVYPSVYPGSYDLEISDSLQNLNEYYLIISPPSATINPLDGAPTIREPVLRNSACGIVQITEINLSQLCFYAEDDRYDKGGNSTARLNLVSDSLIDADLTIESTVLNNKQYVKLNGLFNSDESIIDLSNLDSLVVNFEWDGPEMLMVQILVDQENDDWLRYSQTKPSMDVKQSLALIDFVDDQGVKIDTTLLRKIAGISFRTESVGNSGNLKVRYLELK